MSSGSLEFTLVSASISPYITFETEPSDTYALLRCSNEQHSTHHAQDHGRLPVWNETFKFRLQEQDMSSELLIQVFNVRAEVDELLGLARIPIYSMVGHEEATLWALVSPTQREVGKLKAAWKWKPESQVSLKASSFQGRASERQDYIEKESYTSEPFDPNQPYRSLKATSGEGKASEMHSYAGGGGYGAEAVASYDPKVSPYGLDSGAYGAYPRAQSSSNTTAEPFSKLDAVSDAMAKLAVDKEGYGRSAFSKLDAVSDAMAKLAVDKEGYGRSASSLEDSKKSGNDAFYHEPYATPYGAYPTEPAGRDACSDVKAREEGRGGDFGAYSSSSGVYARGHSDHHYPQPLTHAAPLQTDAYPSHLGTSYPPPPDAFPTNKDTYPPHPGSTYPPPPADKGGYPPYSGAQYPPASSGSFLQNKDEYPSNPAAAYPPHSSPAYPPHSSPAYPPYPDHQSSPYSDVHSQGLPSMEKGGGGKEKGGHKKDKEKGHGSHAPHGHPPASGYPYPAAPQGYPPAPQAPYGYPPAPQGYPPPSHGYPPAQQGYPPPQQGYPPAQHGYPPPGAPGAPHAYPPAPQGYPPHGYPSATQHPVAAPYAYPSSGHSGHHSDKHGHGYGYGAAAAAAAAGAYVGHHSSGSKPSKKHKDPKDSSHYKHGKHGKQKKHKSFKGLKFKKFKF